MTALDITYFVGIAVMIVACLSLAIQNLLVRMGTDTGRAFDAVLIVMTTNVAVLLPTVGIYYYPNYGITVSSGFSFAAAGLFGTMFGRAFKYVSISHIGASRTEPIISMSSLVAALLGVVLLGERVGPTQWIAIIAIVLGVSIISWETTLENPYSLPRRKLLLGMILPFAAAVAYGIEPVFASYGLEVGTPASVGVVIKTLAAIIGFVAYLRFTDTLPAFDEVWSSNTKTFVLAGICNTGFILGFYIALSLAPVSVVTPILPTSTLFTVVLSALFMPQRLEHVTPRLLGAVLIVVAGIIGLSITS